MVTLPHTLLQGALTQRRRESRVADPAGPSLARAKPHTALLPAGPRAIRGGSDRCLRVRLYRGIPHTR